MSLTQQKRLYQAEGCLWAHGRDFSSNTEVVNYLDNICETEWFIKQYGWSIRPIRIQSLHSNKWAGCASREENVIYLRRRTENVVLHEFAHLLCSTDEHDHEFVGHFTFLIRNAMGFYAWSEFTYELEKVDYYGS